MFTNKRRSLRIGYITAVAVLAASAIWATSCRALNNYEYAQGARTGMLNKVSKKGLLWKTYEGQMALEGIVSSGGGMGANVWDFSIDNQARHGENIEGLANQLNQALDNGEKVKLNYIQVLGGWPWRGSTGHYVQSIETIGKK